jgi:hypothetical protein
MKYQVINDKTNKVEEEFYIKEDALDCVDFKFSFETHSIIQVISCRGCDKEGHERQDWYGISTGHWCDECYESNRYTYRKDAYETIERHGDGERLDY